MAPVEVLDFPLAVPAISRRSLVWETRLVMLAFLWPVVTGAVVAFAANAAGAHETRFPVLVSGNPLFNLIFGMIAYLPLAAAVPLALFLLARTGQPPHWLGLGVPRFMADVLPGLGLAAASFGAELVLFIPLSPVLLHASKLVDQVPTGHVPTYYVAYGVVISLVTSVTEEVFVNGYLITRLGQLEWTSRSALILSLVLRTSYHVYYGLGFILTIPFGWFVTRSFQKHRRLTRCIAAHFLFDSSLIILSLTHGSAKVAFVLPFCALALFSACFSGRPAPAASI
jgi:membrane protease YdiL (CAAX protease family)